MPTDPIHLAIDLMACPSVAPHDHGALAVLENILKPLQFTCQRLPFEDPSAERVDNLYARYGTAAPHFCFAGHTDVVPPGNENDWRVHPFKPAVIDGMLYGRGTVDMKGAIACFTSAAQRFLEKHGKDFKGSISLLITGDEEACAVNGTRKMLGWLKEHNEVIDVCVVGEPTNPKQLGEMVKIGRRGSVSYTITVEGIQGHVAYPAIACNPCTLLTDILHRLKHHTLDKGTAHFDPSNLEITTIDVANATDNLIPARAKATCNIRFNDQHSSASLTAWVKQVCDEVMAGYEGKARYQLQPRVSGESFLTAPGALSDLVVEAVKQASGRTPVLSTTGGTSDARFIKDVCPVVEYGLINETAHKVDERVSVADMYALTDTYYYIIARYFGVEV